MIKIKLINFTKKLDHKFNPKLFINMLKFNSVSYEYFIWKPRDFKKNINRVCKDRGWNLDEIIIFYFKLGDNPPNDFSLFGPGYNIYVSINLNNINELVKMTNRMNNIKAFL